LKRQGKNETMKNITFAKMHGLGNCYVYVNSFDHNFPEETLSTLACNVANVHTGIGSDGLILIAPSRKADIKMRIFNKDGSEAQNCGNGLRCVAKYAYEHGFVKSKTMTIETLSGNVQAEIVRHGQFESQVRVNMGKPRLLKKEVPMKGSPEAQTVAEAYVVDGINLSLTAVSMGNPHAVFFVTPDQLSFHRTLGPIIEKDSTFPEGVNVEFVSVDSPQSLHCRVWERGSGVTQACGTGACAVAVASILNGYSQKDKPLTIHLAGGDLSISWNSDGNVFMTGPATAIAFGMLPQGEK
jgi:diaminopimelate epimerase